MAMSMMASSWSSEPCHVIPAMFSQTEPAARVLLALELFLPYHIGGQTALLDRGQVYKPELSHEKH